MSDEVSHCRSPSGKPWAFWATMGFSAIIVTVYLIIHYAGTVLYAFHLAVRNPGLSSESILSRLSPNGFLVALVSCAGVLPCVGLVFLFIWLRKGISWKEYLAVNPPQVGSFFVWIGITALYGIAADGLTYLMGRPVVPEFWVQAYDTAQVVPFFFFALIVAAPLTEEVFFRGFMLTGIRDSVLGSVGAVLIPAVLWTAIHMQYDLYELSILFVAGIILGMARLRTDSIYTALAIHSLINAWACAQILWHTSS